jgi:hypothetical protein
MQARPGSRRDSPAGGGAWDRLWQAAGFPRTHTFSPAELTHLVVYCAPIGGLQLNRFAAPVFSPPPPLPFDPTKVKNPPDSLEPSLSPLPSSRGCFEWRCGR